MKTIHNLRRIFALSFYLLRIPGMKKSMVGRKQMANISNYAKDYKME